MKLNQCLLRWHKLNPQAIIPDKSPEAAGLDLYTIEQNFVLEPHSRHLFSTGLAVAVEEGWWLQIVDRGSTGSKGLHVHCGIVDNDYRGEIFVCLHNENSYPIKFTDDEEPGFHKHQERITTGPKAENGIQLSVAIIQDVEIIDYFVYPASKAIAQIIPILQPEVSSGEATDEEWELLKNTERGEGKLGSSGK